VRRNVVATGALAALLLTDVTLVALALRGRVSASDAPAAPTATAVQGTPQPMPSVTPNKRRRVKPEPQPAPVLDLTASGVALRAPRGDCRTRRAEATLSTDGGKTWRTVRVPLRGLLRVSVTSATDAWVVGLNDRCSPALARTRDGGRTWARHHTGGTWHVLPGPRARHLHAGHRNVASPCPPGALDHIAVVEFSAAVAVCADGRMHATRDGGRSWNRRGTVPKGAQVSFDADRGFAAAHSRSCPGVAVLASTDGGRHWRARGCVNGAKPPAAVVFSNASRGLLVTGDHAYATRNGGRSWARVDRRP